MSKLSLEELEQGLLELPITESPVQLDVCTKVVEHAKFISSHLKMIKTALKKDNLSNREKAYKLYCIAPAYKRLLSYYYIRLAM